MGITICMVARNEAALRSQQYLVSNYGIEVVAEAVNLSSSEAAEEISRYREPPEVH